MGRSSARAALLGLALAACLAVPAQAYARTIHVTTTGNDISGDGSVSFPLRTVTAGVATATAGDIVQIAAGVYDEPGGESLPIALKSGVTLDGAGSHETTIDGRLLAGNQLVRAVGRTGIVLSDLALDRGAVASAQGGGVYASGSQLDLIRCTISRCTAGNGVGPALYALNSTVTVSGCDIVANASSWCDGAGLVYDGTSGSITGCLIDGNYSDWHNGGGGIQVSNCSPTIARNTITDNSIGGTAQGGGILIRGSGTPLVENNVLARNYCSGGGGAIHVGAGCSPTIRNNTIYDNEGNPAEGALTGGIQSSGTPTIVNNIIWGNHRTGGTPDDLDGCTATYSDISVTADAAGTGNITADPRFLDAAADDFRPGPGSPVLDLGSAAVAPANDRDGVPRPLESDGLGGTLPEMGAYERPYMTIDGGARYVTGTVTTIDSFFDVTVQVRVDTGSGFGTWEAYSAQRAATLPAGDGVKAVTVEYDYGGTRSWVLTDTVVLDTTPAQITSVVSSTHPDPDAWYLSRDASLTWQATDTAGVTCYSYALDQAPDTTPDEAPEQLGYVFDRQLASGGGGPGQLNHPEGLHVAPDGSVYVADRYNSRMQQFTADGGFVRMWGSSGSGPGQFNDVYGVAVDRRGYVFVCDRLNHRLQKFTADGTYLKQWGGYGSGDGRFTQPEHVYVSDEGLVYVSETIVNHRIQKFTYDGAYLTKWGSYGGGLLQFNFPRAIAIGPDGHAYVCDTWNHILKEFTGDGIFVRTISGLGQADGQVQEPAGVQLDEYGYVYVADAFNRRIQKFSPTGAFVTKFGYPGSGTGEFAAVNDVSIDSAGRVYGSDYVANDIKRFRLDTKTGYTGLPDGESYFHVRARDVAGNWGPAAHYRVRIDLSPPVTTSTAEAGDGVTTVTLTATDALSGVASTRYSLDGATWADGTTVRVEGPGAHQVQFWSVDNLGNREDTRTLDLTVGRWNTAMTVSAIPSVGQYGSWVTLHGRLVLTETGVPVKNATGVTLWRSTDGGVTWRYVRDATFDSADGMHEAPWRPTSSSIFRMRFGGDTLHMPCVSGPVAVPVRAWLSQPQAPYSVRAGSTFTCYGYLKPRHTPGSYPVTLRCFRYESGRWVLRRIVSARAYDNLGNTKYARRFSLPSRGSWRIIARHWDTGHARTYSAGERVYVR